MNDIVLIDDNRDHLDLMFLALRALAIKWPVVSFESGEECIAAVQAGSVKPMMLVIDVNMPGLDGPQTVELLRTFESTRWVPIVVLSTSEQMQDVRRARAAGADSYVCKPRRNETWKGLMSTLMRYWTETDLCRRG